MAKQTLRPKGRLLKQYAKMSPIERNVMAMLYNFADFNRQMPLLDALRQSHRDGRTVTDLAYLCRHYYGTITAMPSPGLLNHPLARVVAALPIQGAPKGFGNVYGQALDHMAARQMTLEDVVRRTEDTVNDPIYLANHLASILRDVPIKYDHPGLDGDLQALVPVIAILPKAGWSLTDLVDHLAATVQGLDQRPPFARRSERPEADLVDTIGRAITIAHQPMFHHIMATLRQVDAAKLFTMADFEVLAQMWWQSMSQQAA